MLYLIDTQNRSVEFGFYGNDLAKVLLLWFAAIYRSVLPTLTRYKCTHFRAEYQIFRMK